MKMMMMMRAKKLLQLMSMPLSYGRHMVCYIIRIKNHFQSSTLEIKTKILNGPERAKMNMCDSVNCMDIIFLQMINYADSKPTREYDFNANLISTNLHHHHHYLTSNKQEKKIYGQQPQNRTGHKHTNTPH